MILQFGKNRIEWKTQPTARLIAAPPIRRGYGKPKAGVLPKSPAEALKLFITPNIVDVIITETNHEGERKTVAKNAERLQNNPNAAAAMAWKPLTEVELWGFLGMMIAAGVQKQSDVPLRELLLNPRSDPIYKATMSVTRCEEIRSTMRFDDRSTRAERKQEMGKLAPFKNVFDLFLNNLRGPYEPHTSITLDEQLFGYRGRCPFKQYCGAKPEKFGMKIFWICDSLNGYALIGKVYTGKEGGTVTRDLGAKITKELASVFYNTHRVLTMDNFFTSLPLVEFLAVQKLAVVGTVRNNKPDLPLDFMAPGKRLLYNSQFAFRPTVMLVSYMAKKKKVVNLMSSHHNSIAVDSTDKKKPEIVNYYNKTKIGTDLMDQKVANYTTARATRRWPMALWFNILDIAAANAEIIFHLTHPDDRPGHRRRFLKDLSLELVMPQMKSRFDENPRLPAATLAAMKYFRLEKEVQSHALVGLQAKVDTRVRCYKCSNDNKTMILCQKCHAPVCGVHCRHFCEFCIKTMEFP